MTTFVGQDIARFLTHKLCLAVSVSVSVSHGNALSPPWVRACVCACAYRCGGECVHVGPKWPRTVLYHVYASYGCQGGCISLTWNRTVLYPFYTPFIPPGMSASGHGFLYVAPSTPPPHVSPELEV